MNEETTDWWWHTFSETIELYNQATFRDDLSNRILFSRIEDEDGFRLKWVKQYDESTWWIGGKKYWAQLQWNYNENTWTISSPTTGTIVNPTISELQEALFLWPENLQQRTVKTEFDHNPDIADLRLPDLCTRSVLVEMSDLSMLRQFALRLLDEKLAV